MIIKRERERIILENEEVKKAIDNTISAMKEYIMVTQGPRYRDKFRPDGPMRDYTRGKIRLGSFYISYLEGHIARRYSGGDREERLTIIHRSTRQRKWRRPERIERTLLNYYAMDEVASIHIKLDDFQAIAGIPARIQAVISRIRNEQDALKALIAKKVQ